MNYATRFGLIVQAMPTADQVLLLGKLAGIRAGEGWFHTGEINGLFLIFRVPEPSNISMLLSRLRDKGLVVFNRDSRTWSLTPRGQQRAEQIDETFELDVLMPRLSATPGVQYGSERHVVLPPEFAPARWQSGIHRLLDKYPFETNVFLMTRFPSSKPDPDDPISSVIDTVRGACAEHSLTLHLASDRQADDELYGNVGAHLWACQYGIGVLETHGKDRRNNPRTELNDNVLIELGSMLITGRRCAILKDKNAPDPPSDLTSHIYKSVMLTDQDQVGAAVRSWITDDLSLP